MSTIHLASTALLDIAHNGLDGILHGHGLAVEVWTEQQTCLDAWTLKVSNVVKPIGEQPLESSINGRTFEDIARFVLDSISEASRVVIRLPATGYIIDVYR